MSIDKIIHGLSGYNATMQHEGELRALNRLADGVQEGVIVAIGSYRGQTDCALALNAHVPVYAIDNRAGSVGEDTPFGDVDRPYWMRNVLELSLGEKLRPINLLSLQVAQVWTQPIGLLFIDGSHDYESVRDDLNAWLPHVVNGGIVALHDTHMQSIRRAVQERDDLVEIERADITRCYRKESLYEPYTYENQTLLVRKGIGMQDDKSTLGEVRTYEVGLDPVRTCIDVGGNIGAFTAWIKEAWPGAQITAIEPEASSFNVLFRNVGHAPGVNLIEGAVLYNTEGKVLYVNPNNSGCHRVLAAEEVTPALSIQTVPLPETVTLEQIMVERGWKTLDLLKLDCEGSEVDILMNCTPDLLQVTRRVVGEFHAGYDAFMAGIGQRLIELGFSVWGQTDPKAHATFFAVNLNWHEPPTLPDVPPELPPIDPFTIGKMTYVDLHTETKRSDETKIEYGTVVEEKPKRKPGRPKKS